MSHAALAALFDSPTDTLLRKYVEEAVARTADNISPLYRLDAFDWTVLTIYFAVLFVLSLYGAYRIKQVIDFWRYRSVGPRPKRTFAEAELPVVTVQLPVRSEE